MYLSPPGSMKSINFRAPTGAEPPLERKKCKPPLDKFLNTPLFRGTV